MTPSTLVKSSRSTDIRPTAVSVEAVTACQLRCPSCPTAAGHTRAVLGRGFLKLDDFQRLLDANPQIGRVELSNYGEMFLHPDLLSILRSAAERGVTLTADNGVNLNNVSPEVLEGLVRLGFASMSVSIDGATAQTYARYRVGGVLETVLNNVRTLNVFKRQHRSAHPRLRWQFIAFGHNQHEISAARALAAELGMSFFVKLAWGDFSPVTDRDQVARESGTGVASRDEFRTTHGADYSDAICGQLWSHPQINADGKLLGCCRNFWGEFGGNAFRDGLIPTINGERIAHARAMLRGERDARPDVPCTTCDVYLDRRREGRWIVA